MVICSHLFHFALVLVPSLYPRFACPEKAAGAGSGVDALGGEAAFVSKGYLTLFIAPPPSFAPAPFEVMCVSVVAIQWLLVGGSTKGSTVHFCRFADPPPPSPVKMHLCLTVECITSGLHLSVFNYVTPPLPPVVYGRPTPKPVRTPGSSQRHISSAVVAPPLVFESEACLEV